MNEETYSLKELSDDLDISVRTLKGYIRKGQLQASKVGRAYYVTFSEMERFVESQCPVRNYLCEHYNQCLDRAARANRVFECEGCPKFIKMNSLMDVTPLHFDGFCSPVSVH